MIVQQAGVDAPSVLAVAVNLRVVDRVEGLANCHGATGVPEDGEHEVEEVGAPEDLAVEPWPLVVEQEGPRDIGRGCEVVSLRSGKGVDFSCQNLESVHLHGFVLVGIMSSASVDNSGAPILPDCLDKAVED